MITQSTDKLLKGCGLNVVISKRKQGKIYKWLCGTKRDNKNKNSRVGKKGKWLKLGIGKVASRKIYESLRIKANTILRQHHKREYRKILKILIRTRIRKLRKTK